MTSPAGLPLGVQIIGPAAGDLGVIAVGRMLEAITGGFHAPAMAL